MSKSKIIGLILIAPALVLFGIHCFNLIIEVGYLQFFLALLIAIFTVASTMLFILGLFVLLEELE